MCAMEMRKAVGETGGDALLGCIRMHLWRIHAGELGASALTHAGVH